MASIKKNFLYSSILTTANYLFPFLTYPYVARVLGVTNVGICNFVDSIINYFIIFSMLGIGTVGIREIAKYKNYFPIFFILSTCFLITSSVDLSVEKTALRPWASWAGSPVSSSPTCPCSCSGWAKPP